MKKILLLMTLGVLAITCVNARAEDGYPDDMMDKIMSMKADAEIKKDMQESIPGARTVSTAEAVKMFKEKKAVFLDNRVKAQFDTERIKGAKWFFCDDLLKNPDAAKSLDKDQEYLLYCNGAHCWRSPAVAMMLGHLGFKKLSWYRDGIPAWKKGGNPLE